MKEFYMKKTFTVLLVLVLVGFAAGCTSAPASPSVPPADVPSWFLVPPTAEDYIFGIGIARMGTVNLSKQTAETRALVALSYTLDATVQAMLTDFSQQAGNVDNPQVLEFVQSVSRSITNYRFQGAEIVEAYIAKDGTYFSLRRYNKAEARARAIAALDAAGANEDALYAEFKSAQALDALDRQLNNSVPQQNDSAR
jgi:hypothetical protein